MNNEYLKVGDKTYRPAQVIMLPTKDKSNLYKILKSLHDEDTVSIVGNIVYNKNNSPSGKNEYFAPQHLYIVTSEEINEGDYVYDVEIKQVFHCNTDLLVRKHTIKSSLKVIASTDSSLFYKNDDKLAAKRLIFLPKPSSDFIKKFCELNGDVKDVLVEYEKPEQPQFESDIGVHENDINKYKSKLNQIINQNQTK